MREENSRGDLILAKLTAKLQKIRPEDAIENDERKKQSCIRYVYHRINKMKAGQSLSLTLEQFGLLADIRTDNPRAQEVFEFIMQSINSRTINSKPIANISFDPRNKNIIIIRKLRDKYEGAQEGGAFQNYIQVLRNLDPKLLNSSFTADDIIKHCEYKYAYHALTKLEKNGIITKQKVQGQPVNYQLTDIGKDFLLTSTNQRPQQ